MKAPTQFTSIGGQAVIEGVMMRSPHYIAVAVRKPNQRIVIKSDPHLSIAQRFSLFRRPVMRGVVLLIESMVQGIGALSYSANVAAEAGSEKEEELSSWAIFVSISTALVLGMGLFVALPHFLTVVLTSRGSGGPLTADSPWFHVVDGGIKMCVLLTYVYLISLMKDIHRVFQYHGAEHKSIYAFEAGEELTVESARRYTTLHPRCGTSFLLFLVVISIVAFSIMFPLLGLTRMSENPLANHAIMVMFKIVLMLPVAGLSYEFIKMCACRMENPIFRMLIWPGMILQKLTTREPTDEQLEVALASLKQVLRLEKAAKPSEEVEIACLGDLGAVVASVAEFPEA